MAKDKSTHWDRHKGKYITGAINSPWIFELAKFFYKDGGRVKGVGKATHGYGKAMKKKK